MAGLDIRTRIARTYSTLSSVNVERSGALGQVLVNLIEVCQILRLMNEEIDELMRWRLAREKDLKEQRLARFREATGEELKRAA